MPERRSIHMIWGILLVLAVDAAAQTCSDGNACTRVDVCRNGECVSSPPIECEQPADACRSAACDPTTGDCVESDITCDDDNLCTVASCDPVTGCSFENVMDGTDCSDPLDPNPCATSACQGGTCVDTPVAGACDDGNPCTETACDGGTCMVTANLNDIACSDGNPCTETGICVNGACVAAPVICPPSMDPCMPNVCNSTTGDCEEIDRVAECEALSEAIPCLSFSCNPTLGVCLPGSLTEFNGAACDDGNSCTFDDQCRSGICAGTVASSPRTGTPAASGWMLPLLALALSALATRRLAISGRR